MVNILLDTFVVTSVFVASLATISVVRADDVGFLELKLDSSTKNFNR